MNPVALRAATTVVGSRGVRRALGCGCLGLLGLAATPLLLAAGVIGGAFDTPSGGVAALSAGGVIVGSGEPLPAGSFRVSQGFGCTTVWAEAPPPPPYVCPPDAAHPDATRFHTGIDLAAAAGTPVDAVAGGTLHVIDSGTGFGLHEVIDAGGGVSYLYGHLSVALVADGTTVSAGQLIGFVGSSGNSTGPHLHFEVDAGVVPSNPCAVFPPGYLVPAGTAALDCLAVELGTG